MTRDELEAVIWQNLAAIPRRQITSGDAVDAIVDAADAYATAQAAAALGAIDNYRRTVTPVIHFRDDFNVPSCRRTGMADPVLTESPAHVTCRACVRTRNYHEAVA